VKLAVHLHLVPRLRKSGARKYFKAKFSTGKEIPILKATGINKRSTNNKKTGTNNQNNTYQ
jgi:hypothetical protein